MEIWSEIRREVLTGVLSKRAAIAKYGIGWHTLKKMLAHDEPPGYRQANQRPKPKLEPFLPVIRQILEDDGKAPTKRKHAAHEPLISGATLADVPLTGLSAASTFPGRKCPVRLPSRAFSSVMGSSRISAAATIRTPFRSPRIP